MQQIKVDFDNPGIPRHLDVMEGDDQSRFFVATIFTNGKPYVAPEGATYTLMYRGFGPQNQGWYDTIVDSDGSHPAIVVDGNKVTCEIAHQAMRVPGHITVVLCVSSADGYMLKDWPIDVLVRNDYYDDTVEVTMYFNLAGDFTAKIQALNEALAKVPPAVKELDDKKTESLDAISTAKTDALNKVADSTESAKAEADRAEVSAKAAEGSAGNAEISEANAKKSAAASAESAAAADASQKEALKNQQAAATSEANAKKYSEEAGAKAGTDKTLRIDGAPADAKAVGDALAGKADAVSPHSIVIPTTGWEDDDTVSDFPHKLDISIEELTVQDIVNVVVAPDDTTPAADACFANTETLQGILRLRAKDVPTVAINATWYIVR